MPRFGGKRSTKPETYIYKKPGKGLLTRKETEKWTKRSSSIKIVNTALGGRLLKYITELKSIKRHPVVAEWGCDNATALFELAQQHPNIYFIGTSQESHKNWENKPKNVILLHTTEEGIERLANKRGSSEKIDLIYTHFGIGHLLRAYPIDIARQKLLEHLIKLKNSLTIGGRIIMKPDELKISDKYYAWFTDSLRKSGFELKETHNLETGEFQIEELIRIK